MEDVAKHVVLERGGCFEDAVNEQHMRRRTPRAILLLSCCLLTASSRKLTLLTATCQTTLEYS